MFSEVHQENKEVNESEIKDVKATVNLMDGISVIFLIMSLHLLAILLRYSVFIESTSATSFSVITFSLLRDYCLYHADLVICFYDGTLLNSVKYLGKKQ